MRSRSRPPTLRALGILLPLLMLVSGAMAADNPPRSAAHCAPEERAAWAMGDRIIKAVRERSLDGLLALIRADADRVPRRRDVNGRRFDEVFPPSWQEAVLDAPRSCDPVGWRGHMLAQGLLWYDADGIFAFNGIESFEPTRLGGLWRHGDTKIGPDCLERVWLSEDNYQELHARFLRARDVPLQAFTRHPGRHIGAGLPIERVPGFDGEGDLNLVRPLSACSRQPFTLESDGWVVRADDCETCQGAARYQVMAEVPAGVCRELLGHPDARCRSVRLLHTLDEGGGSLGRTPLYSIYALFTIGEGPLLVAPLENYRQRNRAWDRLEEMRK